MGWLQNIIIKWSNGNRVKEITNFVNMLAVMDAEEIALTVAIATDIRHKLLESGLNVMEPAIAITADPSAIFRITTTIKSLQKSQNMMEAAGLMVWAHTLRGADSLEVRGMTRRMWGELSRGFPYVVDAYSNFYSMTDSLLNINGYDEFPTGMTPTPL